MIVTKPAFIYQTGNSIDKAEKVLILIHGRGGSAADMAAMSKYLHVDDYAILAPEADNNTWYPYSFIAPLQENEPYFSNAIERISETVNYALESGIEASQIYFFGFSQGACLTLEYLAQNAQRYGGAVAIIGGVIGKELERSRYKGDFDGTPVFIGTSNPDFHVPQISVVVRPDYHEPKRL